MDQEDFFQNSGEIAIEQQTSSHAHQLPHQQEDDEFDFADSGNHQDEFQPVENQYIQSDQAQRKIKQQEQRIQEKLREKANQEYEQKQKRKEEGRRQLQEFLSKKEQQTSQRKRQNTERQNQRRNQLSKLNNQTEWVKVAANIPLKQGQHKGNKDINRMRESIINKKNDEQNN